MCRIARGSKIPLLAGHELPVDQPVLIARAEEQIFLRLGGWTLALRIDKDARYPNIQTVIPSPRGYTAFWKLSPEASRAALQALAELPGPRSGPSPVTVDLGEGCVFRS